MATLIPSLCDQIYRLWRTNSIRAVGWLCARCAAGLPPAFIGESQAELSHSPDSQTGKLPSR